MQIFHRIPAILGFAISSAFSHAAGADENQLMKAVVAHEYGAPEVLKFEEVPRPEPKEDEALVRVIASGVNPADPLTLSGKYAKEFGTHLPLIPGYDIAGVVEKIGAKITKLKVGEAVYGYPTFGGGWADYEIAKAHGARVIATASTENQDLLKQLGADVPIDYTKTRFEEIAKDVDAVLDPVGKDTLARSYDVVKKGGIVMSLVARPDPDELKKRGIRGAAISVHPDAEDLNEIAHLIDAGKIKPIVTKVLPLNEAVAAQQQAKTHHTRGKIVLRIVHEPRE